MMGRLDTKVLAAIAGLGLAGCGNFQDAVRRRAAKDFNCPVESITLVQTRPYAQPQASAARECGRREDYEGGCDVRGCLVEKRPSLAEQSRMRARAGNLRSSSSGEPSVPRGSNGPQTIFVTFHNDCPRTVKLFFGTTPKFGSGTESSFSANSTESRSMREGEMVWIIDQSGSGISSLTETLAQTHVAINRPCTGFVP
jgi:hypothetical protein